MRRIGTILVFVVIAAFAAAPAAEQPAVPIPQGVTIDGVAVGGLTAEPARTRLRNAFERPLRFAFRGERWTASPSRFGASAAIENTVGSAIHAAPGAHLSLRVRPSGRDIRSYVAYLQRRFDRAAVDSTVNGVTPGLSPSITPSRAGLEVDRPTMTAGIANALRFGLRAPIPLATKSVRAKVTPATIGPIIVIRRGSNQLYLYDGPTLARTFPVATGRSQYPTPLGQYAIVDMQRNPWWRPPDSDWARGLKPIPPGPGNPLGTRWMGTSAPGVGIHGTPDAASVGYSASHGCIRMHIPDAEWLFQNVRLGTPVVIVGA
jgi:lipoprotein-anchoring transpeptidase ErfK/SrfK